MTGRRRTRILAELTGGADGDLTATLLGEVCRDVTGMAGAGIMLMAGDTPLGSLGSTGEVSTLIEDLQYTLGEGPCLDAHQLHRPVLEPDLADPAVLRWPVFAGAAVGAGVRAIFGFPLQVGTVRLGALNLYADRPGPLDDDQHADALVMADVAAEALLAMQAGSSTGEVAAALQHRASFQYVVHQAAGMVSAQLDVGVAEALVRLRSHAFGAGRVLAEVAADVVARRLRFAPRDR